MTRDWKDGALRGLEQAAVATRSMADGWLPHYLAHESELGGGLTITQLRALQTQLAGAEVPGPKPIDWEQWLSWADSDPSAAASASRFLYTVSSLVVSEGRVRWGGHPWRAPCRISPREILRAANAKEEAEWEVDRTTVQQKLCGIVAPRPTDQLIECLASSWSASLGQAWDCLVGQARRQLVVWVCRFAARALCETGVCEPVIAVANDRKQFAMVAVDANGHCSEERVLSSDEGSLQQNLTDLQKAVGTTSVIGCAETLAAIQPALASLSAAIPDFGWVAVDGCGAHWWANHLDAVTSEGRWSALGREALFAARTYQSPLETLAELPAAEFAPADLHQWMDDSDWRQVEQHVDDVIHQQGLNLYRSGPRAVARLCSVSPLHAHRGRPPEGGWKSLDEFRDTLRLNEKQWTQTAPFVRLGVRQQAAAPTAPHMRRNTRMSWDQLKEGRRCYGLVLRAATFGAFLDIGGPCEAMLHISECSRRFVSDPWECLSPGEVVEVEISQLDHEKQRIALRRVQAPKPRSGKSRRRERESQPQGAARDSKRRSNSRSRTGKRKPETPQPQQSAKPPPPPPEPLSQEMADGKAPMRSFSDLVQFYDQKRPDEDSTS